MSEILNHILHVNIIFTWLRENVTPPKRDIFTLKFRVCVTISQYNITIQYHTTRVFLYKHLFLYRGLQHAWRILMFTSEKHVSAVVGRWWEPHNMIDKTSQNTMN